MYRLALVLVLACSAGTPGPGYPLHPQSRPAAGGPVTIAGAVGQPCSVPYAPGLTLRTALRLAGGLSALSMGDAVIARGAARFQVPVADIVAGTAPDLELAPGDQVLVESARISD